MIITGRDETRGASTVEEIREGGAMEFLPLISRRPSAPLAELRRD